jgi:tRNA dimethylallyltransferase
MAGSRSLFLAGPTAVGKSEIALLLAERFGGEIISVDSMQVYRGLDVGTAKPSAEERARVRHHLVDVAELIEEFDAAKFCELAHQAEQDICGRGCVPIFCGGTGLYFKAFLEGLGETPTTDAALRSALEATPLTELLQELAARDPATFDRIDRNNPRRVLRALEVIRLSGKPFSAQRAQWSPGRAAVAPPRFFVLTRPAAELHARIAVRVDEMFRCGLVEETRALLPLGLERNRTALQAIGYRQVVEHLRGQRGLTETIELVKQRTRKYAKRQLTWFRRQATATWVDLSAHTSAGEVIEELQRLTQPLQ